MIQNVIHARDVHFVNNALQFPEGLGEVLGDPRPRLGGNQVPSGDMGRRGGELGYEDLAVVPEHFRLGDVGGGVKVEQITG